MAKYQLVLHGGRVVDPLNKIDGVYDVGVVDGKVAEVTPALSGAEAKEIIDLHGYTLMPGVIDTHTHIRGPAQRMIAKVGVCTALDMGAGEQVVQEFPERGVGLNIVYLKTVGPWAGEIPSETEVAKHIDQAMTGGAIGVKIVGGHNPSTPAATARIIEMANRTKAYVAFHVGTTETGSHLKGLLEAVELAGENSLHIAHVNSYLRGLIKDPLDEVREGLAAIEGKKNLVHESYLAIINGTGGRFGPDGLPTSHVTRLNLKMGGYSVDMKGMEQAIFDGWGMVQGLEGGETVMLTGQAGVDLWKARNTNVSMSFPVNQPQATFLTAVRKQKNGKFVVDAISTDGGSTPRNVAVEHGLALVRYKALTLNEFIWKLSTAGASMLDLKDKGHLGVGADADITVLDLERGKAAMTIVGGKVVMAHGVIYGKGGTIVTTPRGEAYVKAAAEANGFKYQVVHPEEMLIYTKRQGA